uniref:Transcription activator of gluconeogenesis ERT1 n=1 Tax=Mycena chlorophos TaxID=658473 RepID=A0ABQ0M767_MYCCL|nr:predicted protein [Mycena chlorophos]
MAPTAPVPGPSKLIPIVPEPAPTPPPKRRQVKRACTKCAKSSKGCDDSRPCRRCVRYGFGIEECVDSPRKERKKGTKRGPYKKRHSVIVVDQSAIPDAMGYAYSTFYAGPGPDVEPPQHASYYVPGMMLPPMLAPPFLPPPQPPQQQTHTQKQREAALLASAPKPSAMPVMPFHAYAGFAPQQPGLDNYPYQRYPDYSNSRADQ